jgi:hypothetical protein
MEDYASRNWDDCFYTQTEGCHAAYHFADIAIQRGAYDVTFAGAEPYDVVHVITAAADILSGKGAPEPFSIQDKREALLLIAHFVGDIHQPLHVGAVYLDSNGNLVDPDSADDKGESTKTKGGNAILIGKQNLHHEWDAVPKSFGSGDSADITADQSLVTEAQTVSDTTGPIDSWSSTWASESVGQAQKAFQGVSFQGADNGQDVGTGAWTAQLPEGYTATREAIQRQQLERAGARLAQIIAATLP